jgi:GT2 family glycosyltransferase
MAVSVSAVVPTMGRSRYLLECLRALRREGGTALEIVVVDQGDSPVEIPASLGAHVLREERNRGFAVANNRGIAEARGSVIAAVNDYAVVEEGWLAPLLAALAANPEAGAAQGVNLVLGEEPRVDGCGLNWNGWWQAVQVGRNQAAPGREEPPFEVFGVSATAALYRREALERSKLEPGEGEVFDPRLTTYYEDADLAVRLRQAGYSALCVPAARARHAGSLTSTSLGQERWSLLYGNRYLVAAKLLGRGFWLRLPLLFVRDLLDLFHALAGRKEGAAAAGIVRGWLRAARLLPAFAHGGRASRPSMGATRGFQ